MSPVTVRGKPRQSLAGLINISFGFFGIQVGFALQNANMSRIFQSLGADVDRLPGLWVAAPLTGLLVQPLIGHMSDRTWLGRLGRRRPYFLGGAILAAFGLIVMPQAPGVLFAAMMLWIMDASFNVAMEPFRAFVGDMLDAPQHAAGYAVQTGFIGAGAVVGSLVPVVLDRLGVSNVAPTGAVPDTVRYAFWFGALALCLSVGWTVLTTREYAPEELAAFGGSTVTGPAPSTPSLAGRGMAGALGWIIAGLAIAALTYALDLLKEVYLLGALLGAYGLAMIVAIRLARGGRTNHMLASIVGDFAGMPPVMRRLALAQFFSWFALFIMWINTTPIVAQYIYHSTDPASVGYQAGANWVDVLFGIYNGVAAVAALTLLPLLARRIGQVRTHIVGLTCGALGFASFLVIRDGTALIGSEVLIGIAWASILSMPYAILASSLPQAKLGIYMGLFNVFVVVPQLLAATVMGSIMHAFFPGQPVWTLAFAAGSLLVAAVTMIRVGAAGRRTATSALASV